MDIELEQLEIVKMLLTIRDKATLDKIRSILITSHESGRISIEQYNKEIDEAVKRMESGDYVTHEEAKETIRQWRNKIV